MRSRWRRWAIALTILLLLAGDGVYVLVRYQSSLQGAAAALDAGGDQVRDVELAAARGSFTAARADADSARGLGSHPAALLGSLLPPVSEDLNAADVLSEAAFRAAEAGLAVVDGAQAMGATTGDGFTEHVFRDGQIQFAALEEAEPFLGRAADSLGQAVDLLSTVGRPRLGVVRDALAEAEDRVADAHQTARRAEVLFGAMPSLFGQDGTRRYLLAFQSPSEARATGGLIGLYGVLEAAGGRLRLARISYIGDLLEPRFPPVDAPAWFRRHYGPLDALQGWQQANESPHFPVVARVLLQMYENARGERLDGVLAMDPIALAHMLEGTGPLRAAGLDVDVTSENAADVILHDSYLEFPTPAAQNVYLARLIGQFWERVQSGDVDAPAFAQGLAKAVRTQHLKLYSATPEDEEALRDLDAEGDYADEGANIQMLFHNNYAANKVDYFLRREVEMEVRLTEANEAHVDVDVHLTNSAPAGPPSDLLGRFEFAGYRPGFNGMYLNLLLPREATVFRFLQNGRQAPYLLHRDAGYPVAWDLVELDPGEESTVTVRYRVPGVLQETAAGPRFQLKLLPQALVRPDLFTIRVLPPPGSVLTDAGEGGVIEDGVYEFSGALEEELLIEARVVDE